MAEPICLRMGGAPKISAQVRKAPGIDVVIGAGGGAGYVLPPATDKTLGGIKVGDALTITKDGVLSVLRADAVEEDNTLPITSAAVHTELGNIAALLSTI